MRVLVENAKCIHEEALASELLHAIEIEVLQVFSSVRVRSSREKQSVAHVGKSVDLIQDILIMLDVAAGNVCEQC